MTQATFEDAVEAILSDAYLAAFGHHPSPVWLTAIALRVGTRGAVATLDEAGSAAGVTRERVRQVMRTLTGRLVGESLPEAKGIAEVLVQGSPVMEPIGCSLAPSGLSRTTLTGAGFLNVLRLFGIRPSDLTGTDLVLVDNWVVDGSDVSIMKSIGLAGRHTSSYGMTTVEALSRQLSSPTHSINPADVRRVLRAQASVRWAGDWLWVEKETDGQHSNRLVNTARSILSVNAPQTVASIHEGCRRMWKFRKLDILPTIDAMRAFFIQSPYFLANGEEVRPTEPLDYRVLQGTTTATMIDVLKSQPNQVMDRQSLQEACEDAGIARGTYGIWTTYAEWMENFGPNVWGLRGCNPSPAVVEAIRDAARHRATAEPRRKNWRWLPDGRVTQVMDVTTSFVSTGVMSFAPEVHRILHGQSLHVIVGKKQVATAKLGDEHPLCWGWSPVIRELGLERGQVMQLNVDLTAHSVDVMVGGEELWR